MRRQLEEINVSDFVKLAIILFLQNLLDQFVVSAHTQSYQYYDAQIVRTD